MSGINIYQMDDEIKSDLMRAVQEEGLHRANFDGAMRSDGELFGQLRSAAASTLSEAVPEDLMEALESFRAGEIDHLVVRNLPVDERLGDTPDNTRAEVSPSAAQAILMGVSNMLDKQVNLQHGVQHNIRAQLDQDLVTADPWHSHPEHDWSVVMYVRGNANGVTDMLSANAVFDNAQDDIKDTLLSEKSYVDGQPAFALLVEKEGKKAFSPELLKQTVPSHIPGLGDLADMEAFLENVLDGGHDLPESAIEALQYVSDSLSNAPSITFGAGDLMIVDHHSTVRHADSYPIDHVEKSGRGRWGLVINGRDQEEVVKQSFLIEKEQLSELIEKSRALGGVEKNR